MNEERPENEQTRQDPRPSPGNSNYRTKAIIFAIVMAIAAFGFGRWTGDTNASSQRESGHATHSTNGESSQKYTCPMHPDVRSDDPEGSCPICGMDLVPVGDGDKDSESDVPSVTLSDSAAKSARVRTEKATRQRLTRKIDVYGRVEIAEETMTDQTAWVRGRIEHLDIRSRGEHVKKGERIARLYSPKLESAQKEFVQAISELESAQKQSSPNRISGAKSAVEATRARLRVLGMTPSQIDRIRKKKKVRSTVNIYSDSAGMVHHLMVTEGEWLDAGAPIASIHSHDLAWIQLEVYTEDLEFIEEGMPVTVRFPSQPGTTLEEQIDFLDPHVDTSNGTALARIDVADSAVPLRPGTEVRATIESPISDKSPPVSVPESAVLWTGQRSLVYRYDRSLDPPSYVPTEVELGPKAGTRRVIREGISRGDEVVTHGAFRIDAELQIRGEPAMMTASEDGSDNRGKRTVEVPEQGKKFDPGVAPDRVPQGAWYCPMEPTHWAQPEQADGKCPVCGMNLKHKSSGGRAGDHSSNGGME